MSNVVQIKGSREAPKAERSSMETLIISVDQVNQWKVPAFQRPVRVNVRTSLSNWAILRRDAIAPAV